MIYEPLNNSSEQIRLISILPAEDSSEPIHCSLEVVSLLSFLPSYADFISGLQPTRKRRAHLSEWVTTTNPRQLDTDHLPTQIPSEDVFRFTWGDYATLSYTWGDPNDTTSIFLNEVEMQVTRNLEAALRALRGLDYFQGGFKLWVDAICINQADKKERGAQVARMRDIYHGSWTTMTWLGPATDESPQAIELLKTLARYEVHGESSILKETLQKEPGYLGVGKWLAFQRFLQRPYWSRLWIIQEIALSPSNMLMFAGQDHITWQELQDGLSSIHCSHWYVKDACLRFDRKADQRAGNLEGKDLGLWETENLHHIDKDLARIGRKESRGEGLLTFTELLHAANATQTSVPLDKVYGLLAIIDPAISQQIIPDYTVKPSQLFAQVAQLFITHSHSLEILREGNPWGTGDTPSWAPDWLWSHRNRDKDFPRLRYSADGTRTANYHFSPDLRRLTIDAIFIDTVDGIGARSSHEEEAGPYEFLLESAVQPRSFRSAYGSVSSTRFALHCALVGDRRGHAGTTRFSTTCQNTCLYNLPKCTATAMLEFRRRGWTEFAMQGRRYTQWEEWRKAHQDFWLGDEIGCLGDAFTDTIPEHAEVGQFWGPYWRFKNVVSARRFVTTGGGRFGWVPDNTGGGEMDQVRGGDVFVVALGCDVPLVLRKIKDGMYQVLGDGYVQGFMEGEALKMVGEGSLEIQKVTLC